MAARKVIWSARAKIDQFKILDFYFERNGSKTYSEKLYRRFKAAIKLVSKHPEIGIKTDIEHVRNIIVGDYALFNRINHDTIEIIAIWDCRQNPGKLQI